jgi:hypothetical protein
VLAFGPTPARADGVFGKYRYPVAAEIERHLSDPAARATYRGPVGARKFAETHFLSRLGTCHERVKAAVDAATWADLDWKPPFRGTLAEFARDAAALGAADGVFRGPVGYVEFSRTFYRGNMRRAFENALAAVGPDEFARLGWGRRYSSTVTRYLADRHRLMPDGEVARRYRFVQGYRDFADDFFGGHMGTAYLAASSVLNDQELARLDWGSIFLGSTAVHVDMREFLLKRGFGAAVARWFGKRNGLHRLTLSYLTARGAGSTVEPRVERATRLRFRAVVTPDELEALGWDTVLARPDCAGDLTAATP